MSTINTPAIPQPVRIKSEDNSKTQELVSLLKDRAKGLSVVQLSFKYRKSVSEINALLPKDAKIYGW